MKKIIYVLLCLFLIPTFVFAEEYSEEYKAAISSDGTLHIRSCVPQKGKELAAIMDSVIQNKLFEKGRDYISFTSVEADSLDNPIVNEDGSYNVTVDMPYIDGNFVRDERHVLKVYIENKCDNDIKTKLDNKATTLTGNTYYLEDMGLLNLLINSRVNENEFVNSYQYNASKGIMYSQDIIKNIGNDNVVYYVSNREGDADPFWVHTAGPVIISYNDTFYSSTGFVNLETRNMIYVPSNTEDTTEAFIAAATKRIKEYFGNDLEFSIEQYKTITEIIDNPNFDWSTDPEGDYIQSSIFNTYYNGMTNKLDMVYKITIGGNTKYFIIEKDDTKIENPVLEISDPKTDIEVTIDSGEVPLDTTITIENVEDESILNNIKDNLDGEFESFDFNLYSPLQNKKIEKVNSGKIVVGIPIAVKFAGKNLFIYYLTSEGKFVKQKSYVVGNTIYLETNHMSTYIISDTEYVEKEETNDATSTTRNPKTSDTISYYLGTLIVSIMILIITKRKNIHEL